MRAVPCQVIAVKAFINQIQQRVPSAAAKLACLHRNEPLWLEAGAEYVRSGGYKRVVGPDLIKTITMPTMVIWGGEDPILPVADATVFEELLGEKCKGLHIIEGSGHSPQLDNPQPVADLVREFAGA